MAQFFGAVVGIALYLVVCYFAFVWVVVPSLPFVVVAGAVLGALLVVVLVVLTLLRLGGSAAPTVTPADVPFRLRGIRSPFPRDDAWPNYLFAQASTDLRTAAGHVVERTAAAWVFMATVVRDEPFSLVLWPLMVLPLAAALAGTAAVLATVVLLGAASGVVLLLAWLGWLVTAGVLRGTDHGLRVLRRAKATCPDPACTYRSRLPAYRCTCGRVHHDIRAGRQGLFARRCACGSLVPTTVLRAAGGLTAVCQECGRDLQSGAGALTDVLVPVFGSTSAGKTRLIYAGIVALARHLSAVGGTFVPDGADSEATFRTATTIVERGSQTAKTSADRPAGVTARIQKGGRPALLHLFDAAGEVFTTRDAAADLRFLDDPQGMVFVLDPFSIPEVAGLLQGALEPRLKAAEPAHVDPERSYPVTVQWLRDEGVALSRTPLAVAVVKADLLLGLPPAAGLTAASTSADIEEWLRGKGLDNLLHQMARDFGEVGYHLVSSRDAGTTPAGGAGPTSPGRPLIWLLQRTGVPVPDPQPVGAS